MNRKPSQDQAPRAPHVPQYRLRHPKSKILVYDITKDRARQLVDNGAAPRGSIWIPGPLGDNPAYGTLHGPDPEWRFDHVDIGRLGK